VDFTIGVRIIVVLLFIGILLSLIIGLGLIVWTILILLGSGFIGFYPLYGVAIFFILAAFQIFLAWGLWNLKNWARLTMVFICGIGLLLAVPTIMSAAQHQLSEFILYILAIYFGIKSLVFGYLLLPQVKKFFRANEF